MQLAVWSSSTHRLPCPALTLHSRPRKFISSSGATSSLTSLNSSIFQRGLFRGIGGYRRSLRTLSKFSKTRATDMLSYCCRIDDQPDTVRLIEKGALRKGKNAARYLYHSMEQARGLRPGATLPAPTALQAIRRSRSPTRARRAPSRFSSIVALPGREPLRGPHPRSWTEGR